MSKQPSGIGMSLLAMAVMLMALLMFMLSLALVLRAVYGTPESGSLILAGSLAAFGVAYGALAFGLWRAMPWLKTLTIVLLPIMTVAGLIETGRHDTLALGSFLVFALTFITHLVVLIAVVAQARLAANQARTGSSGTRPAD